MHFLIDWDMFDDRYMLVDWDFLDMMMMDGVNLVWNVDDMMLAGKFNSNIYTNILNNNDRHNF